MRHHRLGVRGKATGVTHDGITDPAAAPEGVDLIIEALGSNHAVNPEQMS